MPGEDGVNNSYDRIKTIVVSVNANIRSLDFSEDCKLLRTSNTANHILYWSVEETGPDDDISGAPVKLKAAYTSSLKPQLKAAYTSSWCMRP